MRPGQTTNTALALVPDLEVVDRNVAAEARIVRELATRAHRFTPGVSIEDSNALLLDVRASLKFFGGLGKLRALLANELDAHGYHFVMACAPTALASLWLARSGRDEVVRECGDLPSRLSGLSIDVLNWPAAIGRMLSGMGVTTVGECIRLPKDGLARRIGPGRLAELDQAFGARPETRVFHRPPWHFEESLDLPVETTDAGLLLIALQELLARLERFLCRHQGGVQVLWIALHREGRSAAIERIGLLRASTDTGYLRALARIRFADLRLDAPVVAMKLRTILTKPPASSGRDMLGDQAEQGADGFELVEQLCVRLGAEAVYGVRLVPEHRPEAAWRPVDFAGHAALRDEPIDAVPGEFHYAPVSDRPVWMLEEPRVLQARDGQPVFGDLLRLEGDAERIETGWWDGQDIRRDYYVARSRHGMRLWVYRDYSDHNRRESRWYLHGLFG